MKFGLERRFAVTNVSIVLLLVVLLAGVLQFDFHRTFSDVKQAGAEASRQALFVQMEKKGIAMTRLLADSLVNEMYFARLDFIAELTRATHRQQGVAYVFAYDASGVVVHDGTQTIKNFGLKLNDMPLTQSVASKSPVTWVSDGILHVTAPMLAGSEIVGGIRLGLMLGEIRADTRNTQIMLAKIADGQKLRFVWVTGIAVLVLAAIGAGIAVLAARRLGKPIESYQDALQKSEETKSSILAAALDSIFLFDRDGTILEANEATANRFHTVVKDLIGNNILDLIPPDMVDDLRSKLETIIETGEPIVGKRNGMGTIMKPKPSPTSMVKETFTKSQ